MIPVGPGDIVAAVEVGAAAVHLIQRGNKAERLARAANILRAKDSPERAEDIRQLCQDLAQDRGIIPWYEWRDSIDIPKDMLCDLWNVAIQGPQASGGGMVATILQAFGLGRGNVKTVQGWATTIATRNEKVICAELAEHLAAAGWARHYDPEGPVIGVDLDWLGDLGAYVIR